VNEPRDLLRSPAGRGQAIFGMRACLGPVEDATSRRRYLHCDSAEMDPAEEADAARRRNPRPFKSFLGAGWAEAAEPSSRDKVVCNNARERLITTQQGSKRSKRHVVDSRLCASKLG